MLPSGHCGTNHSQATSAFQWYGREGRFSFFVRPTFGFNAYVECSPEHLQDIDSKFGFIPIDLSIVHVFHCGGLIETLASRWTS